MFYGDERRFRPYPYLRLECFRIKQVGSTAEARLNARYGHEGNIEGALLSMDEGSIHRSSLFALIEWGLTWFRCLQYHTLSPLVYGFHSGTIVIYVRVWQVLLCMLLCCMNCYILSLYLSLSR